VINLGNGAILSCLSSSTALNLIPFQSSEKSKLTEISESFTSHQAIDISGSFLSKLEL